MIHTSPDGIKLRVATLAVLTLSLNLILFSPQHARAQQQTPNAEQKELKKEIEEMKERLNTIQRDLQEIKQLLGRQNFNAVRSREVVVDTDGDPFKGDRNAKLTLIEFSDYQCPFCARYVRETLPLIERDYVKTGKLKYVFRDYPLESIHPNALTASKAAGCAGEQGKYWEMHGRLFANQSALGASDMAFHAEAVGLEREKFQHCLGRGRHEDGIRKKMAEGASLGVRGTPTFFLGLTSPNDPKVKVLRVLRGAVPYAQFKEVIDSLLSPPQQLP
jgi:protein-disulfide isomerase